MPSNQDSVQTENVSVCLRLRPIPSSPLSDIDLDTPTPTHRQLTHSQNSNRFGSWLIHPNQSSISLSPSHPIIDRRGTRTSEAVNGSEGYQFNLDHIFDPYSSTSHLYRSSLQSLIETCVKDGYNVTVFAYGQTGSGKTFTMIGSKQEEEEGDDESLGVIPRAVDQVFDVIASDLDREYLLRVSYLEIYNEALKDLLAADQTVGPPNRLTIQEVNKGRVHVNGIREEVVTHPMQVLDALKRGEKARHVGATDWNERSSRSHTVFTMTIESRPKSSDPSAESTPTQISQLNLIDLAGSESAASSTARRKEGAFINKSLLALSNVISKLSTLEPHIPYRDSKLTRLLQTSLSGNAKVVVICTVSADGRSVVETLSTLRFARRAKMVVTKAERGTILDSKSALLQAYQSEIMSLKAQLQENSQALSITTTPGPALAELNAEKSKAESELEALRFERIRLQEQIEHLNRRILTSHTIQSNVRRANSLKTPLSPTRRRIVSNQMPQPPKRNKGRVTDIGGMMGMLGIGLSASGYLPNGARLNEENQAQFQRELQLEKELKEVRNELNRLKQAGCESPEDLSRSGIDLLKQQIRALEADKENLPVGIAEGDERAETIKVYEDEMETMASEDPTVVDSNTDEIHILKQSIAALQTQHHAKEDPIAEKVDSDERSLHDHQELENQLESLRKELDHWKGEHRTLLQDSESKHSLHESELSSIKKEKDEIVSNSQLTQEIISKLEADLNQLRAEKEALIQKQQEQSARLEQAESDAVKLHDIEATNSSLEDELSSIKREKDAIGSDCQLKQETISKLECQLNDLRAEKEELIQSQQEDTTRLEKAESNAAKAADLEVELISLKKEHEESLSKQQEQISALEAEKSEAQQKVEELQSQLATESASLQSTKEQLDQSQQQQQQEHRETITKLENEKAEAQAKIEELQSQLESQASCLAKAKEDLVSSYQEQIVRLETEQSAKEQSDQAQQQQQQETITKLENEKAEAQAKTEELQSQLESQASCLAKDKEDLVSSYQEQIVRLETDKSAALAQVEELKSRLESELAGLREKHESDTSLLKEKLALVEMERSSAQDQLEQLKSQISSELNNSSRVESEDEKSFQKQISYLEAEKLEAETKYEASKSVLEAEVNTLKKENGDQLLAHQEEITKLKAELVQFESLPEDSKSKLSVESQTQLQEKSDRISSLENQIEGLQSEKSQAQAQIQELTTTFESEIESLRRTNEESLSSQKDQLEKLEVERSELLSKIDGLMDAHDSEDKPAKSQDDYIMELNTKLSEAQLVIDGLTASNEEKEKCVQTLQDRLSALDSELAQLGDKVKELTNEKAGAEENLKTLETDSAEQLKNLAAELAELKISLADERAARLNTDVEFSEKTKTLESELASLPALQADTSSLKNKLTKLEQRLSLERNKSQEKELELMQLIQERDQARGQIENLEALLSDQAHKAQEEDIKSVIEEWEGKLKQAEQLADAGQSKLVDLTQANEALEQKLQRFQSETQRLQADLEKLRTERTSQEIQHEKLERLTSRLHEDLKRMQEKENDSIEKIESIVRERCAAASSRLHESYTSKLTQLEQSNSNLGTHIKGLESHLASVGNGQRQQTTAESMETIVDLQSTIEDQNREIKELRSELESIKSSLTSRPLPSIHSRRSDHDHYHQSTEDELSRLYHIIDEQEKRLSDAKTDLSKWQARVRSQTELISKLKITPESDSEQRKLPTTPNRRSNSTSDQPMISANTRHSTAFNNLNCRSPTKPIGLSPMLGSGPRSSAGWQASLHPLSSSSSNLKVDGNSSPRPLPVPESFISSVDDDDAQRRKNRRRTIEKDMARLKDENVVERKRNSLLCSPGFKDPSQLNNHFDGNNKFKTTMSSSALHRNSLSSNSSSSSTQLKWNHHSIPSSSTHQPSSSASNGLRIHPYQRQSGPVSPTASTFSSISSQRGYYE